MHDAPHPVDKESSQSWLDEQGYIIDQIHSEFYKWSDFGVKMVIPFAELSGCTRASFIAKARRHGWVLVALCLFLSACASTTAKLHPDPQLNLDIIQNYAEVKVQIASLRAMMEDYEGDLPRNDVAILEAAVFDVEFLIMVEVDKILAQPELKVNTKQMDLLLIHGERIYHEVEGVVNRNRMKLTEKDEKELTELGGKLRHLKFNLDLSRAAQQLKQETIHELFQVLIQGSKFAADIVL